MIVPIVPILSTELTETALQALEDQLPSLLEARKGLDAKIDRVNDAIKKLRTVLQEAESENGSSASDPTHRRKKGDNLRLVREWFELHPGRGFTIPEIAKGIGIPHGSVHNVVSRNEEEYRKDEEGKWYLIESPEDKNESGSLPLT